MSIIESEIPFDSADCDIIKKLNFVADVIDCKQCVLRVAVVEAIRG
jgi:hypothetical protein